MDALEPESGTENRRLNADRQRGSAEYIWEGNNLNKISKKIVSLVTVAAFATTLVPAAAFAASGDLYPVNSGYTVESSQSGELKIQLNLQDDQSPAGVTTNLTNALVKITVDGVDEDTTVAGNSLGELDVDTFAETGYKPAAAGEIYTFDNVPSGVHEVTVEVTPNATADPVEWTTLYGYAADADATNVAGSGTATPDVTVVGLPASTGNRILVDNSVADLSVNAGDKKTVEFDLLDSNGESAVLGADQALYVWAQDGKNIVDVIDVANATEDPAGVYKVAATKDGDTAEVTFTVDGSYKLYAGIGGTTFNIADVHELRPLNVTVAPKAFETAAIALDAPVEYVNTNTDGNVSYWTYTINDNVTPNGQKEYTVTGTAYALNGTERVAAENETLTITTQNDNLKLVDKEVKTDAKGNFEFSFKITDTGVGYITIGEPTDQVYANLKVVQNAMAPVSISTAKDGGIMLAGTDDQYVYNQYAYFNDAVQFNIKDAYDRDATGDEVLALVVAANKNATNHADFVEVDAPEGSKLTDNDIVLAWNNGAYTLQYVGNDPVHDLIPGEYTVSVSLNNGVDATATFTLAEFQGAESLAVDLVAADNDGFFVDDANNDAITAIDDQVALGQYVGGTVYLVDEQGLKVVAPATNLSVGVKGAAVDMKTVDLNNPFGFKTFDNTPANQSVIGSVITISAYDEVNKIYTEKELTVVSNYLEETLAFDPVQGPVGENNAVEISVVDKENGTVTAYVESQSNEEATVELKANETVTDGVGRLYLESDAAGTADVVVAVKATNGEVYAATLTYTFGDEAAADGRYIVMTIGSEQYLINNEIFDGSVDKLGAPYIDDAWRTMVPVRVLAETLGAEVEYADNVVTVVDGDTTVEMTIGEKAYTINGEAAEAEMDTVPVIGDGDRTYVPIRFLTNALGYEVNPLYNAEGLTSSVHFTK